MITETLELEECELAHEMESLNRSTHDVARQGKVLYELAQMHVPENEEAARALLKLEDSIGEVLRVIREHHEQKVLEVKRKMNAKGVPQ